MNPVYSRHARRRMQQRHISDEEVRSVLQDHHLNYPDPKGNRILIGRPGGRRIKVVVQQASDPPFIITVAD